MQINSVSEKEKIAYLTNFILQHLKNVPDLKPLRLLILVPT